jgi:hypothetical protein
MTENPYTPPSSDLGDEPGRRLAGGTGDFDIGECVNEAWANTWAHFPLWLGVGFVGVSAMVLAAATVVGLFVVVPVLWWGGTYFLLRVHDGDAEFGDLFAGFSRYAVALVGMLVCYLLLLLVGMVGSGLQFAGEAIGNDAFIWMGMVANLLIAFLVTPRLNFAYFYIVDQGLSPTEAISQAWTDTAAARWKVVVLVILSILFMAIGLLALVVGMIPAGMVVSMMWVSAYRQIVGQVA